MLEHIMIAPGLCVPRCIRTTKKHPQVGTIHLEGKVCKVYIGFWGGVPIWRLAQHDNDPEYTHCAQKCVSVADDPDCH